MVAESVTLVKCLLSMGKNLGSILSITKKPKTTIKKIAKNLSVPFILQIKKLL
jgi:hypothetical protein